MHAPDELMMDGLGFGHRGSRGLIGAPADIAIMSAAYRAYEPL